MLTINGLNVSYGPLTVLQDVSMALRAGAIVSLLGANAAGKSTFMNAISRIIPLASGQIAFQNRPIHDLRSDEIIELGIIQVPEGRRIFPFMTVQENLEMGSFNKQARVNRKTSLNWVYDLFPRLAERYKQLAGSMSGGEQQMLAVGRGLMAMPKILMLDEPSLGLAPLVVQSIFDVLLELLSIPKYCDVKKTPHPH